MKKSEFLKILIIRLSSMGDVILTTPVIKVLKQKYPNAQIDFLTSPQFEIIFKYNPYINNIILFDKFKDNLFDFKRNFFKNYGNYDLVIDLHNNYRSFLITNFLKAKIIKFKKNNLKKFLLVNFKINLYKKIYKIPDLYLKTIGHYGNENLEIWLEEDLKKDKYLSYNPDKDFIAIAPSAKHFTKTYPKEKFVQLINLILKKYNNNIILLGGKEDIELCEYIAYSSIDCSRIINYAGKTNILETTELISRSKILISNDSGIMHIAASRKTPILAIFGSTVKEFGFAPYNTQYSIIEVNLECRPCTHFGRSSCPKKHFNCMNLIEPLTIMEELHKLLLPNINSIQR